MKIREFMQEHLRKRMEGTGCLVVYDATRRYRELVLGMATSRCTVVDAGESIILAREKAKGVWLELANPAKEPRQLVVYVPAVKPESDEEKHRDPFQVFALGGAVFPDGDGDSFLALCRKAKPDHAERIE